MKNRPIGLAVLMVVAATLAPRARAIDFTAGDWKLSIAGNVNAHYVFSDCEKNPVVVDGGLACISTDNSSAVANGLLPAALTFNGSTTQDGYDIGFTFGLYPGIDTNDGGSPNLQQTGAATNTALGTAGLDVRQVFLTFGNSSMGTVMAGRNIGLFGADAILNDMTLIGVGAGNGNYAAPANTSLGSIGLGYIYTDWLAQINYTTPDLAGAKITVGVFDPLNTLLDGQTVPTSKDTPGFHGKVAWTGGPLYLSASFLYQKQKGTAVSTTNPTGVGYDSWAFDAGGKWDIGNLEVLGWYYYGSGVGTTGLFLLSNDAAGNARKSEGFLAQATYKIGSTKLGVNYGESRLSRTSEEATPLPPSIVISSDFLVEKNDKWTVGVYHDLTKNLTLLAEFSYLESENQGGDKNKSDNFNVGAFLKF
ncbi:MAG TPA: porin [Steroidobacteraceae bacterium]|nr:porin [Steroidobacteraceae bacterium]